jgi:hypothetical protein
LAVLALIEPLALGLLPLGLYLFWYCNGHLRGGQILKRASFFLIPMGLAVFWRYRSYGDWGQVMADSALFNLFSNGSDRPPAAMGAHSNTGQMIALVFLSAGTVFAFLRNTTVAHRLIPLYLFLTFLLFSPAGTIATRAPLAGVSMEGIAATSSRPVARILNFVLLVAGIYEVFLAFR